MVGAGGKGPTLTYVLGRLINVSSNRRRESPPYGACDPSGPGADHEPFLTVCRTALGVGNGISDTIGDTCLVQNSARSASIVGAPTKVADQCADSAAVISSLLLVALPFGNTMAPRESRLLCGRKRFGLTE